MSRKARRGSEHTFEKQRRGTGRRQTHAAEAVDDMDMGTEPQGLSDVLDLLVERTDGEKLTLQTAIAAYGTKAFGPLILLPALLLTLPTGILPGVPLVLGAVIALVSLQMMFGAKTPWLPGWLGKISFSREAIVKFRDAHKGWLSVVDAVIKPRFDFLVRPPMTRLLAFFCFILSLLLIPVEFIPFATAVPGSVLILLGLALTAHDGLVMTIAMLALCGVGLFFLHMM